MKIKYLNLLFLLSACSTNNVPNIPLPITIDNPMEYLAEYEADTEWKYQRSDYGYYQHVVASKIDNNHAKLIWSYPPFNKFVLGNGDGGETYEIKDSNVYITSTQDSKNSITNFGYSWWIFDKYIPECFQGWGNGPDSLGRACHTEITFPGTPNPITVDTIVSEHYALPNQQGPMERAFYGKGYGRLAWMSFNQPICNPIDPNRAPPISKFDDGVKCDERVNTNIVTNFNGLSGNTYGWP